MRTITRDRVRLTLAAMLVVASTAMVMSVVWAADFDARIVGVDGKSLIDDKGKTVELTVREAVVNALLGVYPDEQSLSGEEKLRRFELAKRVQSGDNATLQSLQSEDIALMKKLVNKYYPSPLLVPQVWSALERQPQVSNVEAKGDRR